jgi:hypothetical protein
MIELLINYLNNRYNPEYFHTCNNENNENENINTISLIFTIFIWVVSCWAAYLSWRCNTEANYPTSVKLIFSLFAFNWGMFYLGYYYFYIYLIPNSCSKYKLIEVEETFKSNKKTLSLSSTSSI